MVDYSDGQVTLLSVKSIKARKRRKCKECFREIEPGEIYSLHKYVFEDKFESHACCAHCQVVRDWLQDECGGWLYGGVEEDAREHVHDNRGYYGVDLYRAVVGMQWKWRTKSGRLLPIPRMPMTSEERAAIRARGNDGQLG